MFIERKRIRIVFFLSFLALSFSTYANDGAEGQRIYSLQVYGEKMAEDVTHETFSEFVVDTNDTSKVRPFFTGLQKCYQKIEFNIPNFYSFNDLNVETLSKFLYKNHDYLIEMQKCYIRERIITNYINNNPSLYNDISLLYPMYEKEDEKNRFIMKERIFFPRAEDRVFLRTVVLPKAFDTFNTLNKN